MEPVLNALFVRFLQAAVEPKMHDLAKEIINERTKNIINQWDFDEQKKSNPNGCVCYSQDKKCHDLEELNCFFCYCPNYDTSVKEGKCKINSPKGKYIDNHKGKILDCSDCDIPHRKENAIKLLDSLFR